jgi:prepilin-type N-terminal cleavage/methylation domain-containing protein
MKLCCSNQRNQALTLTEVLVVIAISAILVAMLLPALARAKRHGGPNCVSNLKEIGLAYRIWEGDHNDKFPMELSVTNGGTMELVTNGKNAWLNFLVMSNELSTPKILICPADTDRFPPATNFTSGLSNKISYFVGLDATDAQPQTLLSGDDNFEIGGVPVKSGLLELSTNVSISWTAARHKYAGNILLGDGSVQQVDTKGLQNALQQTGFATNRLAIP